MKRLAYGLTAIAAMSVIVTWATLPANAQFGGGGADDLQGNPAQGGVGGGGLFGGGGFGGAQGQNGGMLETLATAVVVSEDQARIAAYSSQLGQWSIQPLDVEKGEQEPITPVLGLNLVGVAVGKRVYAYSAVTGNWDELKIPVGDGKNLAVGMEYIKVVHGDFISMFSAQSGNWATLDRKLAKTVKWNSDKPPQ
ncbi:hypothetical protein CA54_47140 [Symmachiella macrocystis]|uniref:Uncharacterized protein n=1 Tax=Symmachiella macrocystis TaxID=2527985 RepID=A0A5C6BCN6_9PLAN|nr:hypothetical protein [Symmachiella macrocystis]TWU09472.1 hypothetical protein CA54_47140 [Symmachiella macrocystis]